MESERTIPPSDSPYADPKRFAEEEEASRLKSEIDQRVAQFISDFEHDYRKSIEERRLKETQNA